MGSERPDIRMERRLPTPALPQEYNHNGIYFQSPLQDNVLTKLRNRYPGDTKHVTPEDFLEVVWSETEDIRAQQRTFTQSPDFKEWNRQRGILSKAKKFFATYPDAKTYRIETSGSGFPYAIKQSEIALRTALLYPFDIQRSNMAVVSEALSRVFGISKDPFDPQSAEAEAINTYLKRHKDRWINQKNQSDPSSNEHAAAIENFKLFSAFEDLIRGHTAASQFGQRIDDLGEGITSIKFPPRYDHRTPDHESPQQDKLIKTLSDQLAQTKGSVTFDHVRQLIAAEIIDLDDQEQAFANDPKNRSVLNDTDYTDNGRLRFFEDQRERLHGISDAIDVLFEPPEDLDPQVEEGYIRELQAYIAHVNRRYIQDTSSPTAERNFCTHLFKLVNDTSNLIKTRMEKGISLTEAHANKTQIFEPFPLPESSNHDNSLYRSPLMEIVTNAIRLHMRDSYTPGPNDAQALLSAEEQDIQTQKEEFEANPQWQLKKIMFDEAKKYFDSSENRDKDSVEIPALQPGSRDNLLEVTGQESGAETSFIFKREDMADYEAGIYPFTKVLERFAILKGIVTKLQTRQQVAPEETALLDTYLARQEFRNQMLTFIHQRKGSSHDVAITQGNQEVFQTLRSSIQNLITDQSSEK